MGGFPKHINCRDSAVVHSSFRATQITNTAMLFFVLTLTIFGHLQFLEVASYALPDASDATIDSSPSAERSHRLTRDTTADGYTYTAGVGAYKLHKDATTWNSAQQICKSEGGYLAVINSQTEVDAIKQIWYAARPHVGSYDSNHALIGFHDIHHEGQHETINGEPLAAAGFDRWYTNEPSNNNPRGQTENCGAIMFDHARNGYLNDVSCDQPYAFICEQPEQNARITMPRYSATTTTTTTTTAMPELDPEDAIYVE